MAPDHSAQARPPGLGEACSAIARAAADSLDLGEVIVILCEGGLITGEHLPITVTGAPRLRVAAASAGRGGSRHGLDR